MYSQNQLSLQVGKGYYNIKLNSNKGVWVRKELSKTFFYIN